MNTPANLKSAANYLVAAGFFLLILSLVIGLSGQPPDSIAKVCGRCFVAFGVSLWIAAFLLYRRNKMGVWIWWVCSPLVLLQVPIGTALGVFTFIYLNKPDSKAALAGNDPATPPSLPPR